MSTYPNDPLESPWKYDGTYQARHLALLDLIRIACGNGGGGGGYDFDLLNQEATQLLIKGVLDNLEAKDYATEATLSAIAVILDAIKIKTDNLDVALSTIATEQTLQSLETNNATKQNQYNQIDLLTLMYEELQQINKTLKKIYQ